MIHKFSCACLSIMSLYPPRRSGHVSCGQLVHHSHHLTGHTMYIHLCTFAYKCVCTRSTCIMYVHGIIEVYIVSHSGWEALGFLIPIQSSSLPPSLRHHGFHIIVGLLAFPLILGFTSGDLVNWKTLYIIMEAWGNYIICSLWANYNYNIMYYVY